MRKPVSVIFFMLLCLLGHSQNDQTVYPDFVGLDFAEVQDNSEWGILKQSSGDLNKDGHIDVVLILESKKRLSEKRCSNCNLRETKPRIILVALHQNGSKEIIIQNNQFIARGDEGGMLSNLEPEISLEDGSLTISYQYVRSEQSYTFKFKNGQMLITHAESSGVGSASGNSERTKYNFEKGEITTETGNISEEKGKTTIYRMEVDPKTLSEFGKMHEWEVAENNYL